MEYLLTETQIIWVDSRVFSINHLLLNVFSLFSDLHEFLIVFVLAFVDNLDVL